MTANRNGSTISTITVLTAATSRRVMAPIASASTAATAITAAVPTTIRAEVSVVTGGIQYPPCRITASPTGSAIAVPIRPTANVTPPSTTALAASTRPRRGDAVSVVLIRPRRYSAVTNPEPTTTIAISAKKVPVSMARDGLCPVPPAPSGTLGAMSPDPDTVYVLSDCL